MKTTVKAKSLREGDKIELDDGIIGTIRGVSQVKEVIPKRLVEYTALEIEVKSRKNGRLTTSTEHVMLHADETTPLTSRDGVAWKYEKFMQKNYRYVNAFASAVVGSIITMTMAELGIVSKETAIIMAVATLTIASSLVYYAWSKS
jgi:hypothetical protein